MKSEGRVELRLITAVRRGPLRKDAWHLILENKGVTLPRPAVIPDLPSFRGAPLGANPESIGPWDPLCDGFRVRDVVAPRNDAGLSPLYPPKKSLCMAGQRPELL